MSCATGMHMDDALALVARARGGACGGACLPVADRTIAIGAQLATAARDSGRVVMRLARPSLIVGFHAGLVGAPPALEAGPPKAWPRFIPRLEDIIVTMDISRSRVLTASSLPSNGVPLAAMVLPQRAHMLLVDGPNPELGFTFESVYASSAGSGLPELVGVMLTAFICEIGG